MSRLVKTLVTAAAAAASLLAATPSHAGECPADKVGVNVTPPGPDMPRDVTDTVISSIDLSKGYGIDGRQLRMRRLVIQPGGVVPWHGHAARPANIYVVSGNVTEYRSTCAAPITHRKGEVVAESGETFHWWRNNGWRTAVLLSADILPPAAPATEPGM